MIIDSKDCFFSEIRDLIVKMHAKFSKVSNDGGLRLMPTARPYLQIWRVKGGCLDPISWYVGE